MPQTVNLTRYDSSNSNDGSTYKTLNQSIAASKKNKINYANLGYKITFENKYQIFDEILVNKYRSLLLQSSKYLAISEDYYYKPELLSKELYGTVDLWYVIMAVNAISSVDEFNSAVVRVLDPDKLFVLNEIIEKEKKDIAINNANMPNYTDLTIKPVRIKQTMYDF